MEEQIITIYCICDDFIRTEGFEDWPNVKLTTSEVMLICVVAMRFFYGNFESARKFLYEHKYVSNILSPSGLNKRIHKVPGEWWHKILVFMQSWSKKCKMTHEYIVDSFPVAVCRNIRIRNCRIYQGKEFRGYNSSKREYFYGLKVTVLTTRVGCPIRTILCPGCEHDIEPFRIMDLGLPRGSEIYGDSAYTDYEYEDKLLQEDGVRLIAARKDNTTRPIGLEDYMNLKHIRGAIESAFGVLSRMLPRKIHAVTQQGFEVKVLGFLVAFATTFV